MAGMELLGDTLACLGRWRQRRQGVGEPCRQDIARDWKTPHEIGVPPPLAILRLALRLAQIERGERRVEIVQKRSMVKERAASPSLRVARYLAPANGEIGSAGN
jgi:hypothetical protein